jgi:transcriptional regulator with XRE-family HTH domain
MESTAEKFAAKLKEFRKGRKMTQETLAERLGVATETVQNWERGRRFPEPHNIDKLSTELGVQPAHFFSYKPLMPTPLEALEVLRRFIEDSKEIPPKAAQIISRGLTEGLLSTDEPAKHKTQLVKKKIK